MLFVVITMIASVYPCNAIIKKILLLSEMTPLGGWPLAWVFKIIYYVPTVNFPVCVFISYHWQHLLMQKSWGN